MIRNSFTFSIPQCRTYPRIRNTAGTINFTLLADVGDIRINRTATKDEIFEALDFYREGL